MTTEKRNSYAYCFVPGCKNTSVATPEKLFFNVPKGPLRNLWCKIVKRHPVSLTATRQCCEDHFKLEEDVEDWMRYRILKESGAKPFQLRLKNGVVPHIFGCQPVNTPIISEPEKSTTENREAVYIKQEVESIAGETEPEEKDEEFAADTYYYSHLADITLSEEPQDCVTRDFNSSLIETPNDYPRKRAKIDSHFESLAQIGNRSVYTTSLQIQQTKQERLEEIETEENPLLQRLEETEPEEDSLSQRLEKIESEDYSLSQQLDRTEPEEDRLSQQSAESEINEDHFSQQLEHAETEEDTFFQPVIEAQQTSFCLSDADINAQQLRITLWRLEKNPRRYMGLHPRHFRVLCLLDAICKTDRVDIYIVLRKIRLDEPLDILADAFGCSENKISETLIKCTPIIARFLRKFIYWPEKIVIQHNLPLAFMAKYSDIESIVDCFEVAVEKESKPYFLKTDCNRSSIKYLISITPAGFISFISEGYERRTTNKEIVEKSSYLERLKPDTYVMADQSWEQINSLMVQKQCHLILTGVEMQNHFEKESEVDARLCVEQVVERLGEFAIFKPRTQIKYSVSLVNSFMKIVCALSNLSDHIEE